MSLVGQNCRHELTANLQKHFQQGPARNTPSSESPPLIASEAPPLPAIGLVPHHIDIRRMPTMVRRAIVQTAVPQPRIQLLNATHAVNDSLHSKYPQFALTQHSPCGSAPAPRRWRRGSACRASQYAKGLYLVMANQLLQDLALLNESMRSLMCCSSRKFRLHTCDRCKMLCFSRNHSIHCEKLQRIRGMEKV